MNKSFTRALLALVLTATTTLKAATAINTVLVSTNRLTIPYAGTYASKNLVKLGNYSLTWQQAAKGADIIATLPTNILSGTYTLTLQGSTPVSVEIGSVSAAAALNARIDLENARAENAETDLTNSINAETARATGTEAGLSNSISSEAARASAAETDLTNAIAANSNNILATVAGNLNSVSNNIVTSLTKNFTTAYAFGPLTVNPYSLVNFSSFIGNWSTNGTEFKIPANGIYQISFAINPVTSSGATRLDIQINVSNNNGTNGVGYFTGPLPYSLSGQITVQCYQGDEVSLLNTTGNTITCNNVDAWMGIETNVPCATVSILQIQ